MSDNNLNIQMVDLKSQYMKIKPQVDQAINDQGWIINQYGEENLYLMYHRGGLISLDIGKVLNLIGPNPNSGIFLKGGIGSMYHKIRIEDIGNLAPQLNSELMKGYDKLCMGLSIGEMIGYIYFSKDKRKNFFIGLESIQGFTNDVRRYDYNKKKSYIDDRIDILTGIKFGWIFLIDRKNNNLGYEVGNIQLVCSVVNKMKLTLSDSELYWWCKNIVNEREKNV